MLALWIVGIVVAWLLCGVRGYFFCRWDYRQMGLGWDAADRWFHFTWIGLGPLFGVVGLAMYLERRAGKEQ